MARPDGFVTEASDIAAALAAPPGRAVRLWWLGQAGFVLEGAGRRVVIDPYLSDSLALKYRGKRFPHVRMMPAPVAPDAIAHVDLVCATHAHTDHLDPGTLPALMAANPDARLLAPVAVRDLACERAAIPPERLLPVEAGETHAPVPGITVRATRAAHEDLARDAAGHHLYLGYGIELGGVCVFHSGDTVPFEGQAEEVSRLGADVALFPVNGRDAFRAGNGVPGNMNSAEALDLARAAGISRVIGHHWGMFDFNTADPRDIRAIVSTAASVYLEPAQAGRCYLLSPVLSGAERPQPRAESVRR